MPKMKNRYFVICILVCISGYWTLLLPQSPVCGYDWLMEHQGTSSILRIFQVNHLLDTLVRQPGNQVGSRDDIVIPVVVHIVWNSPEENISDERIFSQIEILNKDFNGENVDLTSAPEEFRKLSAQKGIRFCLAVENPQGEPASGITRTKTGITTIGAKSELYSTATGGCDAWDTKRYFNIWVANTGDFLTGFGAYPGQVAPEKDGMVVHPKYFGINNSKRYNLGRVSVHEAGHYFGLRHTWGEDEDCSTDDGVEDTPPQMSFYKGCPAHPQVSCGNSDMFMNFMDYVDDDCMVMFTQGQMDRMLTTIEMLRPGLMASEIPCIQRRAEELNMAFTVYPNPGRGAISIRFRENVAEIGSIEVYNSIGQEVYKVTTVLFDSMKVDLPDLIPGVYWVKIGGRIEKFIAL